MDHTQIKIKLLESIATLLGRSDRIEAHWQVEPPKDWEELAVFRDNDEVINCLDERTHQRLLASKLALSRIESGDWETCIQCGNTIQTSRHKIIPTTTLCVSCAELNETDSDVKRL